MTFGEQTTDFQFENLLLTTKLFTAANGNLFATCFYMISKIEDFFKSSFGISKLFQHAFYNTLTFCSLSGFYFWTAVVRLTTVIDGANMFGGNYLPRVYEFFAIWLLSQRYSDRYAVFDIFPKEKIFLLF